MLSTKQTAGLMVSAITMIAACPGTLPGAIIEVGPGRSYERIEDATAKARPGDTILVYPRTNGEAYERVAVLVRERGLIFRASPGAAGQRVRVSGKDFNYTGTGDVPRAVFQFNPEADNCVLEGFELSGAHNSTHNGAGVRIHSANHVLIRDCDIHDNDMGIMSNGDGTPEAGVDQRIEACAIHHNGSAAEPGFNHNLYLGGTSVTLSFCDIHGSLTGHNVKSRAHHTRVQYCYVHDSANRELDLVDAAETARPDSDAVLIGNIISKAPGCKGNRGVIHFGRDVGKERDGTLHLVFNTIITPFVSPVVDLSSPGARAVLVGNLVSDGGARQTGQVVASGRNGAVPQSLTGKHNWFSGGFSSVGDTHLDAKTNRFDRATGSLFLNPTAHNYHITPQAGAGAATPLTASELKLPAVPGMPDSAMDPPLAWQYRHPAGKVKRPSEKGLTFGAYAR